MLIVDSQIHIWQNGKMSAHHRQIPTYSVDDALAEMASAGVDCAVIHPPSSLGEAVNALAVEAVRQHPDKFCILGHFDLAEPGSREASSPIGASGRACSGFGSPSTSRIRRRGGPMARSTGSGRRARRRDCPSGSWPAGNMAALAKIAERHPGLKLHIDHIGRGGGGAGVNGRRGLCRPSGHARARQAAQCRGQAVGRAELFEPALPVQEHPRLSAPDLRGVRARPLRSGAPTSPACRARIGNA